MVGPCTRWTGQDSEFTHDQRTPESQTLIRGVEQNENAELEFYEHGEWLRRLMRELAQRQPDAIEEEREPIDTELSDAFQDQSAQEAGGERAVCAVQDQIGFSGAVRMVQHARDLESAITRPKESMH